ncbi:hypothetical protein HDZ31DRAFT_60660 [Schizophyllum fasciatum]
MSSSSLDWASAASPTFTATSCTSSFDIISGRSRSSTTSTLSLQAATDDDEIVWGVQSGSDGSDGSQSGASSASEDEDFVLLNTSRPTAEPATPNAAASRVLPSASTGPAADADTLADELADLSLSKRKTRRGKRAGAAARARVSGAATPESDVSSAPSSPRASPPRRKQKRSPAAPPAAAMPPVMGLGARPIVEDVSDVASERADDLPYEDAAKYITTYLSNPTKDRAASLTLLQSLIIELGIAPSALPDSLTAARNLLKAHAFLNIREYLAVRAQGPDAVQRVMHPSRSALIRDIRKKRNAANLRAVKESGLNVLLVTCYH